jgi:pyruvate kinase
VTVSTDRFQRVKIIATLGPASSAPATVTAMARAGADGFRLNTAHLQPGEIARLVGLVRGAENDVGRPLAVLCDLAGPKLRLHAETAERTLETGDGVTISAPGGGGELVVEGLDPARELHAGALVSLHDGTVRLEVRRAEGQVAHARVLAGGRATPGMGINLPNLDTSLPSLTERDLTVLAAAVEAQVDVVALSFVRRAQEVAELRRRLGELGCGAPVVAKLEKASAVRSETLNAILATADSVMVARGDLGAETAPERVPVLQKEILRAARAAGVGAITATEMLESMTSATRPTRAEASDVANAVFDGSDALLLTAETAVGAHPVLAVQTCSRIAADAEAHPEFRTGWSAQDAFTGGPNAVADAVARAAVVAASDLAASTIVCFTTTGRTARFVARHRPGVPVLALTPSLAVARALALTWGVEPRVAPEAPDDHEEVVRLAERQALAHGVAAEGELVVVTHGAPLGGHPPTNLLRVHRVGAGTAPP